jgi:hypothetical protein
MWTMLSYHHALEVDLCRGSLVLFQNKGSQLWNIMTCKPKEYGHLYFHYRTPVAILHMGNKEVKKLKHNCFMDLHAKSMSAKIHGSPQQSNLYH